jgi:hypothetical protein
LLLSFSLEVIKEESIIIGVVEYHDPFATFFVA